MGEHRICYFNLTFEINPIELGDFDLAFMANEGYKGRHLVFTPRRSQIQGQFTNTRVFIIERALINGHLDFVFADNRSQEAHTV